MEDYKEKYEQALENIKQIKTANKDNKELVDFIEYKYPELKESEDEKIKEDIISLVNEFWERIGSINPEYSSRSKMLAWLENKVIDIKFDKIEQKPAWSEEDYNEIETIACHLDNINNEGMAEVLRNIRDKYYHIIPQNTWKPSDEQMEVLVWCKPLFVDPNSKSILESIIEDLKKLRKE